MVDPQKVLTSRQITLLKLFGKEPTFRDFYLTGGTALAAFYLGHRLSDDLDFFTESPMAVSHIQPIVHRLARVLGVKVELGRQFETLFECSWVFPKGDRIEMDFALDMPGRQNPIRLLKSWNLRIDNLEDISCNKVSALYERSEPKDFVDVYVLARKKIPLSRLVRLAQRKYPGLDGYGLAMAFLKVKDVTLWPKRLGGWKSEDVRSYFVQQADRLTKGLFK